MFSKVDKMWAGGLVTFISLTTATFFGYEIPAELQAGLVTVIMAAVYWVPNKS